MENGDFDGMDSQEKEDGDSLLSEDGDDEKCEDEEREDSDKLVESDGDVDSDEGEYSESAEHAEQGNDAPLPGDLIFSEIMFNTSLSEQWIEVRNISGRTLSLSDCVFSSGPQSARINSNEEIEAEQFAVFAVEGLSELPTPAKILWNWPEEIALDDNESGNAFVRLSCSSELIDYVNFVADARPFEDRVDSSLALCPGYENATDNDDLRNWHFSETRISGEAFGTPGQANDECPPPDGDEDSDLPEDAEDSECENEYENEDENEDEAIEIDEYIETFAPSVGDLIFTEFMSAPMSLPWEDGQWIEVFNTSDKHLQMEGCTFSAYGGSSTVNENLVVEPHAYALFGIERSQVYPGDVKLAWVWGDFKLRTNSDLLAIRCNGKVVDAVQYKNSEVPYLWQYGGSLALCAGKEDAALNNNMVNWRPSTVLMPNNDRATPGYENEDCNFFEDGDYDSDNEGVGFDIDTDGFYNIEDCRFLDPADFSGPDCGHMLRPGGGVEHEICTIVPVGECHSFYMGSQEENRGLPVGRLSAKPIHTVHLTSYSMSRHPVTVAEYRECMRQGKCREPDPNYCLVDGALIIGETNINDFSKLDHPVVCVNRYNAIEFCSWIGGTMTSEAQWEYAAAGPMNDPENKNDFAWGNDTSHCHTNIWGEDPFEGTSPVGFFDGSLRSRAESGWIFGPQYYQTCDDSSPFGLHDMNHNISTLVADLPSLYSTWPANPVNPLIISNNIQILKRGSSWFFAEISHAKVYIRDVSPDYLPLHVSTESTGFRCAFTDR